MKSTEWFKDQSLYGGNAVRKPYIIAEAGVNHEGNIDLAKRLIEEAKEGGADAIKFQTYKAETLASKNSPSYWDTSKEAATSQFELFKRYDSFWKGEYEELKKHCDAMDIEFMSTPFDATSAEFLNDLMDVFKISSSDITNEPFIRQMCSYGKPIILSTGASYMDEIKQSVDVIREYNVPLCLMHCVLNYPTLNENAHLGMIKDLIKNFPDTIPGYSDHTLPYEMDSLMTANLLGAVMLEKHFTHDKTLPGNDHYHAMDMHDLKHFRKRLEDIYTLIGDTEKKPLETEAISRQNARRSLIASMNIKAGEVITEEHLTWKRPAFGIPPFEMKNLVGKKAVSDIEKDAILQWDLFE